MTTPSGRQRRSIRNYLINPKYQFKYILWLVLSAGSAVIAFVSIFFFSLKQNYELLVSMGPPASLAKAQLRLQLNETFLNLTLGAICFLVFIALIGLIVSHRTAGALYRYKKVFEAIDSGDAAARIHCRPTDDFLDVADSFNRMMNNIKK